MIKSNKKDRRIKELRDFIKSAKSKRSAEPDIKDDIKDAEKEMEKLLKEGVDGMNKNKKFILIKEEADDFGDPSNYMTPEDDEVIVDKEFNEEEYKEMLKAPSDYEATYESKKYKLVNEMISPTNVSTTKINPDDFVSDDEKYMRQAQKTFKCRYGREPDMKDKKDKAEVETYYDRINYKYQDGEARSKFGKKTWDNFVKDNEFVIKKESKIRLGNKLTEAVQTFMDYLKKTSFDKMMQFKDETDKSGNIWKIISSIIDEWAKSTNFNDDKAIDKDIRMDLYKALNDKWTSVKPKLITAKNLDTFGKLIDSMFANIIHNVPSSGERASVKEPK